MAASKSRRSRKPRGSSRAPRAVASNRREIRAGRRQRSTRDETAATRTLGTVGDRPASPFGGLPVSEIVILAGIISLVIGLIDHGGPALIVGVIACALGVIEVTAREHFSGFRSHATLLAAVPALVMVTLIAIFAGIPRDRGLVFLPGVPVFVLSLLFLRRSFQAARHQRVVGQR